MADTSSSGVSGVTLLLILFVGLKLTGHITWSWFWVVSPVWIMAGIVALFLLFVGAIILLGGVVKGRAKRGQRW